MLGSLLIYTTIFIVILVAFTFLATIFIISKKNTVLAHESEISDAHNEYRALDEREQYFSKRELGRWEQRWASIRHSVEDYLRYQRIALNILGHLSRISDGVMNYRDYFEVRSDLKVKMDDLSERFENGYNLIGKRNQIYVSEELERYRQFLDTMEPYPLTKAQREAIVIDEAHNLVVAGAGTGKTSTIVGKALYLLEKGLARGDQVLILSFTRAPKDELIGRLDVIHEEGIGVKTFHSLGLEIIGKAEGRRPSLSRLSEDSTYLRRRIQEFIEAHVDNFQYLDTLFEYFTYYLRPQENIYDFATEEEYEEFIRSGEIRTLQGEKVKSYGECEIANFLYVNGVSYEYEREYDVDTSTEEQGQYRPDFFLPDHGLWIEHFGIDREFNTAPGIDREVYFEEMQWKRRLHKKHSSAMIETFGYQLTEGILVDELTERLKVYGVKFNPVPHESILGKLKSLGNISRLAGLVSKFLNLYKSSNKMIKELRDEARNKPFSKRFNAFLDIFEPLHEDYERNNREEGSIDFHDMINLATEHVEKGNYQSCFKYVLVDEFQDISQSRYRLLKALLEQNEEAKLFCVGDDWQAIYRFAGGDLTIMTHFREFFYPSETMFLDETFRYDESIRDLSSNFMMKNPHQYRKEMKAHEVEGSRVTLVWYDSLNEALGETLEAIGEGSGDIFVIGRYNERLYRDLDASLISSPGVKFITAHSSKGTETDSSVIIGLSSGDYGFPCMIEDDPVLDLVMARDDSYPNAEERRVFYVAATRAREHVYLLADRNSVSPFIAEIANGDYNVTVTGEPPVSRS